VMKVSQNLISCNSTVEVVCYRSWVTAMRKAPGGRCWMVHGTDGEDERMSTVESSGVGRWMQQILAVNVNVR
jgi:hypothetical protein